MATITKIPDQAQRGFIELNAISDSTFDNLNVSITKAPICLIAKKTAKHILSSIQNMSLEQLEKIISSVSSLIAIQYRERVPASAIAEDVVKIIKKGGIKELKFINTQQEKRFFKRIITLIENEKLFYSVKAYAFYTEQENLFSSAQIITDIRPIFGEKSDELPKVGIITTLLKIHYHRGDEHKDIYFGIDGDDIKELKRELKEAEERIKSLEIILKKGEMTQVKIN
jgi:hypothetical protein